jgi:cell division control protein 24
VPHLIHLSLPLTLQLLPSRESSFRSSLLSQSFNYSLYENTLDYLLPLSNTTPTMSPTVRQKSLAGSINIEIPRPTQTNGLLNKSASSSSSLYQQCSQLRARLLHIPDFHLFLDRTASEQNSDPVNHLWDTFALGTPLCYLYNLLPPPASPIDVETDPSLTESDPSDDKAAKKTAKIAVIKFIMAVQKMQHDGDWEERELFQVTEITERNLNGFVKVRFLFLSAFHTYRF